MIKRKLGLLLSLACLALAPVAVNAADITLRATANSNENDEDYDGLVVFKNLSLIHI